MKYYEWVSINTLAYIVYYRLVCFWARIGLRSSHSQREPVVTRIQAEVLSFGNPLPYH